MTYILIYICMKLLETVNFLIVLMKIKLFKMNTEALNKNIGFVHRKKCFSYMSFDLERKGLRDLVLSSDRFFG